MDDIIYRESLDTGVSKGVVEHVLEIHVTSPSVPTLDLVDLPGIVAGRLANEPHDMMEQTRALVEKYLKMPHTLVLAVVPAGERVRNSQAFQLVQQFGLVDRTIGVLTMADRAGDATDPRGTFAELMDKLDGHADDLVALEPHGYVAVKNRDTRLDESQQLPLATFKVHELEWFAQNLSGYVEQGLASSGALAVKIERMLVSHVKDVWVPHTVAQLGKLLKYSQRSVKYLGDAPQKITQDFLAQDEDSQLEFLLKTFDAKFVAAVIDCVDGVVVALARTLLQKIVAKRDANRQKHSLLRGVQMKSLVEKMLQRDETSELLREFVPSTIFSAFLRLSLLVAEALPVTSKNRDLSIDRLENLHLLPASSLWEKTEELLLDKTTLADRMVQAMGSDLVPEGTRLAAAFDCDDMLEVDPAVDHPSENKVIDTVPLPLEDYFVPVVASVSARARLAKPKPSEFGNSGAWTAAASALFFGLSASEIRNAMAHAAACGDVECASGRYAEILRLARHACESPAELRCTDCNLLRALTRHHVHVCEQWPLAPGMNSCIVCSWHHRVSTKVASFVPGPEPSRGEHAPSSGFTIGAPPELPDDKPQRGRRASLKHSETPAKSPKPQQKPSAKEPNPLDGKPREWSRPHWLRSKVPQTGAIGPRFGRRRYYHNTNQYAAPDTKDEELRRLVGVLSRFVVAPLVHQLLDVPALHRHTVEYLTRHPLGPEGADSTHWFAENCAKERGELLDEQKRLQAALEGLKWFQ